MELDLESRAAARAAATDPPDQHKDALRLWLRLLTCTMMIEGEIRTRLRQQFAVTLPRFDLMAQLDKAPDGMTLGELSRRMMVSNGNVTGLVERLVEQGFVVRLAHPTDRRAAIVRLTDDGRRSFSVMAERHGAWVTDLFARLPDEGARTLMRLLGIVKQSVRAIGMSPR